MSAVNNDLLNSLNKERSKRTSSERDDIISPHTPESHLPVKTKSTAEKMLNLLKRYPKTTACTSLGFAAIATCAATSEGKLSSAKTWKYEIIKPIAVSAFFGGYILVIITQLSMLIPKYIDLTDPEKDLTLKAEEGKISRAKGREKEIENIIDSLTCESKANALLVGPPGVGKTAIAEELAVRIAHNDRIPEELKGKRMILVKATDLIEGSMFLGQAEMVISKFVRDLEKTNNIIFIDEMHALSTIKTSSGNARDMLKPVLARKGGIVGCTTTEEAKVIMGDKAFMRRFQQVDINEPSGQLLFSMLEERAKDYTKRHHCSYTKESLLAAIKLTKKLPGHYPDKALAVLDQAGARTKRFTKEGGNRVIGEAEIRSILGKNANPKRMMTLSDLPRDSDVSIHHYHHSQ